MNGATDISWFELGFGYLLIIIPLLIFGYYKTKLVKPTIIATVRMTIQLLFVGVYLKYIFEYNNTYINIGWVLIMIYIASATIIKRSGLSQRKFLLPIIIALSISMFLVDYYTLAAVIRPDYILEARYFIPITGMILGNCLRVNVIALNTYYSKLNTEKNLYRYALSNGATQNEALLPFMQQAIKTAFNPSIANMAVMGLISLPGMMTGQLLGGSSPMVAIKYQILILLTIFVSTILTVYLTILLSNRFVFDKFGNFDSTCINNTLKKKKRLNKK